MSYATKYDKWYDFETARSSISRLADCAPWIDDTPVMRRVHAELEAEAGQTARAVIKLRARVYALRPRDLDVIAEGLSRLSPRDLAAALYVLMAVVISRIGMGGEVPSINLRAATLYARYSRAKEQQIRRRAA